MKHKAQARRQETRSNSLRAALVSNLVPPVPPHVPRTSMVVPRMRARALPAMDLREHTRLSHTRGASHVALATTELFCPFPASKINPHVHDVQRASIDWAHRLGLVRLKEHRTKLDEAKIAWLEGRAFPSASRKVLQFATDWTTLFCLLDDGLEARQPDPIDLSAYVLNLIAAFKGAATKDLVPIGEGLVDLRHRLERIANERHAGRFMETFEELLGGFLWEEINRWKHLRPTRQAYCTMRQITVGARPQFVLGEIAAGIELSERVRKHRDILQLESITCSVVGHVNDIFTCAKELERDRAHNAVLIMMDEELLSLTDVVVRLTADHDELIRTFETTAAGLPDFQSDNNSVTLYLDMLRNCIRGHLDWARETSRYMS